MQLQERFHKFMNEMDFISQDKAHSLIRTVIIVVAIVSIIVIQISYLVGFYFQKFSYCVYSVLVAMAFLVLIVMPGGMPWWKQPPRGFAKSKSKTE